MPSCARTARRASAMRASLPRRCRNAARPTNRGCSSLTDRREALRRTKNGDVQASRGLWKENERRKAGKPKVKLTMNPRTRKARSHIAVFCPRDGRIEKECRSSERTNAIRGRSWVASTGACIARWRESGIDRMACARTHGEQRQGRNARFRLPKSCRSGATARLAPISPFALDAGSSLPLDPTGESLLLALAHAWGAEQRMPVRRGTADVCPRSRRPRDATGSSPFPRGTCGWHGSPEGLRLRRRTPDRAA